MNESTLKTVIGICPGWEIVRQDTFHVSSPNSDWFEDTQEFRDALAAAAVRVVDKLEQVHEFVSQDYEAGFYDRDYDGLISYITSDEGDRTENTLTAIAEFVEKGLFDRQETD